MTVRDLFDLPDGETTLAFFVRARRDGAFTQWIVVDHAGAELFVGTNLKDALDRGQLLVEAGRHFGVSLARASTLGSELLAQANRDRYPGAMNLPDELAGYLDRLPDDDFAMVTRLMTFQLSSGRWQEKHDDRVPF